MDASHVALVDIFLRSEGFQYYKCDQSISLGINIRNISKILKCSSPNDIITMKAESDGDQIEFKFESPNSTRISHFQLKLMNINNEHLSIPDTPYKSIVHMSSVEFKRICTEIVVMSDVVLISISKHDITFSISGDMGTGFISCKQNTGVEDDKDNIEIKTEQDIASSFALKYLNFFSKATPLTSMLTLMLSPNMPMVLEYAIEGVGHVRYYLAPNNEIENEDNGIQQIPIAP